MTAYYKNCDLIRMEKLRENSINAATYLGSGFRFVGSTVEDKNACRKESRFCPFWKIS